MKELTVDATIGNVAAVTAFVDEQLEQLDCPMKTQMQVDIAIDELFGNIAHYAYDPDVGAATVRVEVVENPLAVVITFIDNGVPYDPLANADPDITLSAEEREVGGLGIYMVKKSMDDISYEYKDGQNILRIKKNIRRNCYERKNNICRDDRGRRDLLYRLRKEKRGDQNFRGALP